MTQWEVRQPPVCDEELARWTLGDAPQLRLVRAALHDAAIHHPAAADGEDLAERLTIVASELAGNALRHGVPPAVVILQRSDGKLVIDVLDNEQDCGPAVDRQRRSGDGGLGLILAQRLAAEVGWYPTDTGKGVWAAFALAGH